MRDVAVIGGGAAGIIAARRAADLGARVTLFEKNPRLGMKILISGGGKCNLTHAGDMEAIRRQFRANEALFLKPSFYRYSNEDFLKILHDRGMKTYSRPDGRIFPVEPANAKDVVALLTGYLEESGVEIRYNAAVTGLTHPGSFLATPPETGRAGVRPARLDTPLPSEERAMLGEGTGVRVSAVSPVPPELGAEGAESHLTPTLSLEIDVAAKRVCGVWIGNELVKASQVIVCTGGSSYPATGTTGDGWRWLRALGHSITPLRAALAPIYLRDVKPEWSGIALRDVTLKARSQDTGKELSRWTGDLLFTHKGISGPAALAVSRDITEYTEGSGQGATLEVNLAGKLSFEILQRDIKSQIQANPRRSAASLVVPFVVARLAEPLMEAAGIDPSTRLANLPTKSVNRLIATIKGWPLGEVAHIPIERGEVVAGGVSLDEVDSKTMASKLVDGLYLCGEVLDIAGPVGGYNLQAAWSTGYVAGEDAGSRTPWVISLPP